MSLTVRESGVYAEYEDEMFLVAFIDRDRVATPTYDGGPDEAMVPVAELSRLERVRTVAQWNGTEVHVTRVLPSLLTWVTVHDAKLASQRRLYGNGSGAWGAAVPLHELDDIRENVEDLLRGRP